MATYARKTRIRPTVLEQPSPELLPGVSLDELTTASKTTPKLVSERWWEKLAPSEQTILQVESEGLAMAMLVQGYSRLAIGAHLVKAQAILEPHHVFGKFLKLFRFTARTAYRYIQRYNNASSHLPETILRTAMVRGIDISGESVEQPLGRYTTAAKALPPPADPTDEQAGIWLDSVVKAAKEKNDAPERTDLAVPIPQDPDTLLKECYRFCSLRYRKLPINSRIRKTWVHHLSGMLLTDLGVGHAQSVAPIAVPEEFRAMRGRPREGAQEAAA